MISFIEQAQQSGRFEKVSGPVTHSAQLDSFAELPRGFQNLNQDGDAGCIDVDNFAEVHNQELAFRCGKHSKKQWTELRGGIDTDFSRELCPAFGPVLLAFHPKIRSVCWLSHGPRR